MPESRMAPSSGKTLRRGSPGARCVLGDVVVELPEGHLAGVVVLLGGGLVPPPQLHVRLDLGQLGEHLLGALHRREDRVGLVGEPRPRGDVEQERRARLVVQRELVPPRSSHRAAQEVGLSGTRSVFETRVMYHEAAPTPMMVAAVVPTEEPVGHQADVLEVGLGHAGQDVAR
jgi:hypothetical protein